MSPKRRQQIESVLEASRVDGTLPAYLFERLRLGTVGTRRGLSGYRVDGCSWADPVWCSATP